MFSRREVSKPEVVDPNLVVGNLDRLLRRAIGDDRVLLFDPAPDLPYVKVDPGHLEQVLLNLVINARDATQAGGRIMVATAHVRVPADREPSEALPPGEYSVVAVSDSGTGMTADVLARAFDPFFTTKPKGKGTGLGLSIVYGIVRQSGGHLEVDSEPGKGTTVRVYLSTTDETRAASPGATLTPTLAGQGELVLLVEDEDAVRALTHRILLREGYRVVEARNAGEAILLFEQQGEGVDLLLSDVVMPQLAGPLLAERLRRIRSNLKVLFMSGYADAVDHELIAALDAHLLLKPVSREDLLLSVRRVLDAE
jgi:CheY-like chemotaxis protein